MPEQKSVQEEVTLQLPLKWVDDESPLVVADQFVMRQHGNLIYLVIGHVSVPLVTGTPEEQQRLVYERGSLPVHVRGRFLLDKSSAVRLHDTLGAAISQAKVNEESNG